MGILESFGALNEDGTLTDAFKARALELYKKYNPGAQDIDDQEKYTDWYKQLLDGTLAYSCQTLDVPAPVSTIPVFDPSYVATQLEIEQPPLDLASIIASFAVPQAAIPALLDIKPDDIPSILKKLPDLVQPPPAAPEPKLPPVEILPSTGQPSFGGDGTPNYPSQEGLNLALINSLPSAQLALDAITKDPTWWATFTPDKLFETAKGVLNPIATAATTPETSDPSGWNADVSVCVDLAAEAMAARTVATTVGGTKLLEKLGEIKGYVTKKVDEAPKDGEALKNNLYRLKTNEKNMALLFPNRDMSYGDNLAIETIYALANHMYENTSYRDPNEDPVTLEIGNITGNTSKSVFGADIPEGLGWRNNPWSPGGHGGMSFDMAYPMRDENGEWMSGMAINESTGEIEEFKPPSPFKCVGNDAGLPFKINGKLPHDFPAMYEIGRWMYHEWFIGLIKEGRLLPWSDGFQKRLPYMFILMGKEIYKEFNVWAINNHGIDWNTAHVSMYKSEGWHADQMFGSEKNHEDHMHVVGCRTRVDTSLSAGEKVVHRVYPARDTKKEWKGQKVQKDFGTGPETIFI